MIIPLTQSTDDLHDALYDSLLKDETEGDFFFDALRKLIPVWMHKLMLGIILSWLIPPLLSPL